MERLQPSRAKRDKCCCIRVALHAIHATKGTRGLELGHFKKTPFENSPQRSLQLAQQPTSRCIHEWLIVFEKMIV